MAALAIMQAPLAAGYAEADKRPIPKRTPDVYLTCSSQVRAGATWDFKVWQAEAICHWQDTSFAHVCRVSESSYRMTYVFPKGHISIVVNRITGELSQDVATSVEIFRCTRVVPGKQQF